MSKRYEKLEQVPVKLKDCVIAHGEKKAIKKKKALYDSVAFTSEQQNEFDNFWIKAYGKKIPSYWHKVYQCMNGSFDVKYFPEILLTSKLISKVNQSRYSWAFSDKCMVPALFNGVGDIYIAKTFLFNSFGHYIDSERRPISYEKALKLIENIGVAIIKPTLDTNSGSNVIAVNIRNGIDEKSGKSVKEIFDFYKENFIVQEKVSQHESISIFNESSLNTFRVTTYLVNDDIKCAPCTLLFGGSGSCVSNAHAGGMSVGIDFEGNLMPEAYQYADSVNFKKYTVHPASGTVFGDVQIPEFKKIIETAKILHGQVPQLGLIAWDLSLTKEGKVVLIELNLAEPGVWLPQIVNGCSLFGDDTEYMLHFIKKGK